MVNLTQSLEIMNSLLQRLFKTKYTFEVIKDWFYIIYKYRTFLGIPFSRKVFAHCFLDKNSGCWVVNDTKGIPLFTPDVFIPPYPVIESFRKVVSVLNWAEKMKKYG